MISGTILDFDIANFPFLDGDVPRRTSYGVYISQLIRFARPLSEQSLFIIARRFVVCLSVCHFVLCFSILLVLRLPRLGKRELILVFFVRLFGLCLFRFVGFLFLLGSGKGCGL